MNRETAEHVAELAALLAQRSFRMPRADAPGTPDAFRLVTPCPPHIAAREALALCSVSKAAHRFAERQCNSDPSEAVIDHTHAKLRARAAAILDRFGLCAALQFDPRGWPIALFASASDRDGWETCGSPRELLRVTPNA